MACVRPEGSIRQAKKQLPFIMGNDIIKCWVIDFPGGNAHGNPEAEGESNFMNVWQMVQKLVLGPIQLLLDAIYAVALRKTGSPGWSIVVLSLTVSLLLLPLYRRADTIQKEERDRSLRMKPRIDQIKAAFTGNERFMILQTYYRQNHYKPYYALKSSVSLLLQIPFFMAAYGFLSRLQVLQGVAFGPIRNLGAPDGMLQIGGITVHVLPILMTLVNIISGMLYSRNMPLKSKIQMYALALVFLVLLYNSPSGLVLYWTMNNVFSLVKNMIGRIPRRKVRRVRKTDGIFRKITPAQSKGIFWFSCVFLALMTGLLIPSEVIKSSPAEFLNIRYLQNPLQYVLSSFLLAAGTFPLWCGIYFCMSGEKARRFFAVAFAVAAVAAAVNFIAFGGSYGDISSLLEYERPVGAAAGQWLFNTAVMLAVAAGVAVLIRKAPGLLRAVFAACCIALAVMSVMNMTAVQNEYRKSEAQAEAIREQNTPAIHLSKTGQNVVVIMLDRSVGGLAPYILNEKPELARQFDGFTYYPNTLSFGFHTNVGSPVLFGGYEYTPDAMAERTDMLLVEKQNEALKVMPVLFLENGFDVTVMDPPLANYQWIPDLSIYDDYPEIHRYNVEGFFTRNMENVVRYSDEIRNRNLFCYSLFRISPVLLQPALYHGGDYNATDTAARTGVDTDSMAGVNPDFLQNYWVMENLITMTEIREDGENCFLMFATEETHDIVTLQEPDYMPVTPGNIDNSAYEAEHGIRTAADGSTLDIGNADEFVRQHYQCNMLAFLQLGRWFDCLRANGVWDNTRIIIVSDHAYDMGLLGYDLTEKYPDIARLSEVNGEVWTATMAYEPLLMVKDFGAVGFTTDHSFMTNGDTPVLATQDLIRDPVNPFTGNPITSDPKYAGELHLIETDWHIEQNNGYAFSDPLVITFRGRDVTDIGNWIIEH